MKWELNERNSGQHKNLPFALEQSSPIKLMFASIGLYAFLKKRDLNLPKQIRAEKYFNKDRIHESCETGFMLQATV